MRKTISIVALTAVVALTGCGAAPASKRPGPVELGLVTLQLQQVLNTPAENFHENFVRSNSDKRIYPEELIVTGEGAPTPVDWWAYDQGFIRLAGVADYRGYFALTPKGADFAKAPKPRWLMAVLKGAPQLNCGGGDAWANCNVSAVASVQLTPDGARLFGARSFPDQAFTASLQYGPAGWRVADLQAASGPEPSEAARTWFFGDRESIAKARYKFALAMNRRV